MLDHGSQTQTHGKIWANRFCIAPQVKYKETARQMSPLGQSLTFALHPRPKQTESPQVHYEQMWGQQHVFHTHFNDTSRFCLPSWSKALTESSYMADAEEVLSDADTTHPTPSTPLTKKGKKGHTPILRLHTNHPAILFLCLDRVDRTSLWQTADWERGSALSASALFSVFSCLLVEGRTKKPKCQGLAREAVHLATILSPLPGPIHKERGCFFFFLPPSAPLLLFARKARWREEGEEKRQKDNGQRRQN